MSSVSGDLKLSRKTLATEFLSKVRDDLERVRLQRIHYVLISREHGLTNQEIGDALGISEARVRQIAAVDK